MKPFIRKKLPLILIAVQAVLIMGILFYIVPGRYRLYDIVLYDASENVPANPLIGYAPRAERQEDCAGTDLVFILLPFSEWEPQEGVFDIAGIEEKYHVAAYKSQGKQAVLRFVCDSPRADAHRDIPEWLYLKTADGMAYDDESGKGYAPAYGNAAFLDAHGKALQALAAWCAQDSFVAYVELGSVGRDGAWGAWASTAPGLIPSEEILEQIARQYEEAFPEESGVRLLCSAGFERISRAGSWSDCLGENSRTAEWAAQSVDSAVIVGAESDPEAGARGDGGAENKAGAGTQEAADAARAESGSGQGSLWTREPVGGGMTETVPMKELLMEKLSDTLYQIRSCRPSFIGPVCPDAEQQKSNGSEMILRNVGYCIYLSRLQTTVDYIEDSLQFHLTFSNIGEAPMYWDWPVKMYLYDREGKLIQEQSLALSLSSLLPDSEITVTGSVPYSTELLRGYSVGISITNPEGTRHITLAQKGVIPDADGIHRIYKYRKR
ncbi:MAG: DUF4832 domain-containing protein [Eubacteriales bacterium]|nr:DUF4832 domain-containing protein [Eubacteriales bacterium]